jgi:hypothetical protein
LPCFDKFDRLEGANLKLFTIKPIALKNTNASNNWTARPCPNFKYSKIPVGNAILSV